MSDDNILTLIASDSQPSPISDTEYFTCTENEYVAAFDGLRFFSGHDRHRHMDGARPRHPEA